MNYVNIENLSFSYDDKKILTLKEQEKQLKKEYKQSLLNKTISNPLIKMCNEFKGNEKFGCIYLGEDVRSETSKMFADLFEN